MIIESVELLKVSLPFKETFVSSVSSETTKEFFLIRVLADGVVGYGESGTTNNAFYVEETNCSLAYQVENFLIPLLFQEGVDSPLDFAQRVTPIRRNYMAKALVESAVWDLYAKLSKSSLWQKVGGVKDEIEVGVSIGLQSTVDLLLEKVSLAVEQGYRRVKLKIEPGSDVDLLHSIRREFPKIPLMVDANGSYSLSDIRTLRRLDDFELLMIEQPLDPYDLLGHATLAREVSTPICLDEAVCCSSDLEVVMALEAGSVVNLKVSRVGGVAEALKIERLCRENGIGLWCGGLYEAGVGRALNLAIASLEGVNLPGDTSPSSRYFERDIIRTPFEFESPGLIKLGDDFGIGVEIDEEYLDYMTLEKKVFVNPIR